jgi:hypothetical protein
MGKMFIVLCDMWRSTDEIITKSVFFFKTVMSWKYRANNITNVPEGLGSANIS